MLRRISWSFKLKMGRMVITINSYYTKRTRVYMTRLLSIYQEISMNLRKTSLVLLMVLTLLEAAMIA
jgi:hypothetical protein